MSKTQKFSIVIVGAGPAGLAAAVCAAQGAHAESILLVDEQAAPGGQIYRNIEAVPSARERILGKDYAHGRKLVEAFRRSGVTYWPNTSVWSLNAERQLGVTRNGQAQMIHADVVIVTLGAMERPVAFPGWTLPGVMNAGAGQILYKAAGVVPSDGVVLAGSGPLLLLLAWQYYQAGVKIKALLDVTPPRNHMGALVKLPRALLAFNYISKGLHLQWSLWKAGVPMRFGASDIHAIGDEKLTSVVFTHRGKQHTIDSPLLLTHFGVIPNVALSQAAGCEHYWDPSQQCWRPLIDEWCNSSLKGVLLAGDGAGIHGARFAEHQGTLAALQARHILGGIGVAERDKQGSKDRAWMQRENHIRPFLEAYYQLPDSVLIPQKDETLVCRCEEVTAGQVRDAVARGLDNSNQVKFFTRCGMGPCQGRQCGQTVAHIVAQTTGKSVASVGAFRGRPPTAPLSLGELANLQNAGKP